MSEKLVEFYSDEPNVWKESVKLWKELKFDKEKIIEAFPQWKEKIEEHW